MAITLLAAEITRKTTKNFTLRLNRIQALLFIKYYGTPGLPIPIVVVTISSHESKKGQS